MSRNIEVEFKNMVNKEDFDVLLQYFQVRKNDFITQKNYYFDTKNLSLGMQQAALRIREKEGSCELTLKKAAPVGNLEINQSISPQEASSMLAGKGVPQGEVREELTLMQTSFTSIEYQGMLQTERSQARYKNGWLMFDHNTYLHKEDFEIEYEVDESNAFQGEKDFYELLYKLNIPRKESDNKIKRFFHAKREGSV
ncbi:CYTH domain-containing protein [Siminovitchia sediminis]|uniref:CYTH domain-containing protein n=1 Tax=Siminovitchia sediminis TaxID=1274353 RepID=A0ABW4KCB8_9BACI